MKALRLLAVALVVAVTLGIGACGSSARSSSSGGSGSGGQLAGNTSVDTDGDDDPAAIASACQKLISNSEIAGITGVTDLAFDPTGSVVNLAHARICPYQDAKGYEAIVTVYTGPAYGDAFATEYGIMKGSPNPVAVANLGKGAVWVDNAHELDVDLGQHGLVVQFLFNDGVEQFADPMAIAVRIATVVTQRI